MQMIMDTPNWPRTQVLPSLFKSEPSPSQQLMLRPLIVAAIQRHDATPCLPVYHQPPHQSQAPEQQAYYNLQHQHQHVMPIKREPESSFDFGAHRYQPQYSQRSHSPHHQQSLPVLADMLRGARSAQHDHHHHHSATIAAPKNSLSFILDGQAQQQSAVEEEQTDHFRTSSSSMSSFLSEDEEVALNRYMDQHHHGVDGQHEQPAQPRRSVLQRLKVSTKRRASRPASRTCKFEGCDQYVVDHGLCVRHGGGKRCITEGCTSRAKHFGRCWRHGGSMECKITGCVNRAKSRGFCWSHGGGTKCKAEPCEKIAISNGLCWAHGGGKRCVVDGCMKQAYERTQNYCNSHHQQWKQGHAL